MFEERGPVQVSFSDGTEGIFDVVVGADGIHSQVREEIFGKDFLKHYGSGVWAYWLPDSFKYPAVPTQLLGNGKACFVLPTHNSSTVSFIARTMPNTRLQVDRRAQLRELFGDFEGFAKNALEVAPPSNEIFYDDICFVRMPQWYTGRVVLIGDAQHAVSPLVGMGSSMAMEDAYVLAEELRKNPENIEAALEQFAKRRTTRMKKFILIVNRIDQWFRAKGFLAVLRNKIVNYVSEVHATKILRELLESKV